MMKMPDSVFPAACGQDAESQSTRSCPKEAAGGIRAEAAENTAQCSVCFRRCILKEGQTGFCRARRNTGGKVTDANYGRITSAALDPIEKKPLKEFYPGSTILSVGSYGCNLRCPFCQNHSIAQNSLENQCEEITPRQLVDKAHELKPYGCIGLAFTYNEPMVGYEFVRDCSKLAHEEGLKNVVVTNGCASHEALEAILPYVDAFNIDLKGFSNRYYEYVGGDFEMVKAFIRTAAKSSHVELTTLIVSGKNDSVEEIEQMARWIQENAPSAVLHLTRYFPQWKETAAPTPVDTLRTLETAARRYLSHVYLGNV